MGESTTRDERAPDSDGVVGDVQDILELAEPGIVDLVSTYEQIEELYFAAAVASTPATPSITYSSHT